MSKEQCMQGNVHAAFTASPCPDESPRVMGPLGRWTKYEPYPSHSALLPSEGPRL